MKVNDDASVVLNKVEFGVLLGAASMSNDEVAIKFVTRAADNWGHNNIVDAMVASVEQAATIDKTIFTLEK